MAVGDDLLAGGEAFLDDQELLAAGQGLYHADLHGLVRLGNVNKIAVRPGLQRFGRHQEGTLNVADVH